LAKEEVAKSIDRERKPYTQDHYLFEKILQRSNGWPRTELKVALGLTGSSRDINSSAVLIIVEAVFDKNQRKSIDTHMAEQMEHAVDAYGKVVLKRFIDVIPQICWYIIRSFPQQLEKDFRQINDEDLAKRMVDNSSFTRRSKSWKRKHKLSRKVSTFYVTHFYNTANGRVTACIGSQTTNP
jgi:hypothetical protein